MFSVRPARESDIPALLHLLVQVNMVHHLGRPDLFKGPTTKYEEAELRKILSDPETPVFVCVDENDQVCGHGFCVFEHQQNTRLMTEIRTLYIDDICVDEQHRGQHIGQLLYEHILAFAKENGCYHVTLNVWSCNPGALRFYEKLGLVPYKICMEKIL